MSTTDREPDLLDWREPPQGGAAVVAFPLDRCVGKARTVAKVVMRCKTEKTQQAAFDRAALSVARRLRAAGVDETDIAEQIGRFAQRVNAELRSQEARRQA